MANPYHLFLVPDQGRAVAASCTWLLTACWGSGQAWVHAVLRACCHAVPHQAGERVTKQMGVSRAAHLAAKSASEPRWGADGTAYACSPATARRSSISRCCGVRDATPSRSLGTCRATHRAARLHAALGLDAATPLLGKP